MKKITLTLYILFYSIIQNAQIPEINWGQKYSVRGRGKAIGHTDDYFFIRHNGRKNKKLIQVNLEDNIIKKISLDFKFKGDEVFIDKIINTASADYLLGSNHHKKSQRTFVHATPISASGQIGKSLEHLYTYDYKRHKSWGTNDQHNQDVMGVKLSQDSTKVIFTNVTSNKDHRKKKYKDEYIINVFNDKECE
jgi:hypothetical protein